MGDSSWSNKFQNVMSAVLVCCAAAVTWRLYSQPSTRPNRSEGPVKVLDWASISTAGHQIGQTEGLMTIVEFADFECSACGGFEREVLRPFMRENPKDVKLVFRHWPLSYHRFAMPAAKAAECASEQGRFPEMYRVLYDHQDSLGLKSFREMAQEAGVRSVEVFDACSSRAAIPSSILRDAALAVAIGGTGTPTVVVEGLRFQSPPTRAQLDSILTSLRHGGSL